MGIDSIPETSNKALLCGSNVCVIHDIDTGALIETGFPKNNHSGGGMAVYIRMEEIMIVGGDNDNTTEFYNPRANDWVLFGPDFPADSISKVLLQYMYSLRMPKEANCPDLHDIDTLKMVKTNLKSIFSSELS